MRRQLVSRRPRGTGAAPAVALRRAGLVGAVACGLLVAGSLPASAHAVPGRMTGGGSVFTDTGVQVTISGSRVTHGFELHCIFPPGSAPEEPNNLEINWGGNRFHLETLTQGFCIDDEAVDQRPPSAPFDTYIGAGSGRYNGASGAVARWVFVDAGEPGTRDTAAITITFGGSTVLSVPTAPLTFGNHQAHRS